MFTPIKLECVCTHKPAPNNHYFIVIEDYTIDVYTSTTSATKQSITIPAGFKTDLASVDYRIPFAYAHIKMGAITSAVVHDYLYTTQIFSREIADLNLRKLSKKEGLSKFWSNIMWLGVRIGGGSPDHWKQK